MHVQVRDWNDQDLGRSHLFRVERLFNHPDPLAGGERVLLLVALLRAAHHYHKQVDLGKRELDSRQVPLVERLEPADEKPRGQQANAGSKDILNIYRRK